MKALVCGAGLAGLTLTWHLERAGWQVELVERAPAFRDGGYMIDFYGPGYEVAGRMGLHPRLEEVRYPVDELGYLDGAGRQTSGLRLPPDVTGVVSLLRADLARAIADAVRTTTRYGTSVTAVAQPPAAPVQVTLTDGSEHEVDLLVGSDGTHSTVRELVFGPERDHVRHLGHHVAAYSIHAPELSREIGTRYRMLTVPGLMAGAYALRGERLALLFLHRVSGPALPADPVAVLRERFGGLGWILPEVLPACPPPPELYYDQVTQVELGEWSRGRVVLLGDACQAVSLFAGHGASMAMTAAHVLATELAAGGLAAGEIGPALAGYERRMRPVIERVQRFGRRFIHWMAPPSRLRITARDLLLRAAALPGADRLLVGSLSPGGHGRIP
ncbi:FAD-dependent monooxygenase [Nonomuraea sp. NPDC050328]|uniref:FAD-dependent monooxygenase n=1 Tax=Nonomuraea sp. NPDC050328 TaxID=3364361 RepID=UPI0037BAEA5B